MFDKEELNIKILKCLDKTWQPKVITISETKDLITLTITTMLGNLRENELKINKLKELEDGDRNAKGLALKIAAQNEENSEDYLT